MVTMVPVLLSLPFILGPAVPRETPGTGPYSLTFLYTGVSRPRRGFPRFQATAFLNDHVFFHYNSDSRKAEPREPWIQMKGMENWKKEGQLQMAREELFLDTLRDIMNYYNDSKGSHTFQGMFGCEIQNNRSNEVFWRYAYDGQDFIHFAPEAPGWVPSCLAARETKKKWEAHQVYVQRAKAYLEKECPGMLKRYLNYSRTHLDQKDPPSVSVTSHVVPGKSKTLRCLAYNFYPKQIDLRWVKLSKTLEDQSKGDVLPSGNGTYQSWVVAKVPLEAAMVSRGGQCERSPAARYRCPSPKAECISTRMNPALAAFSPAPHFWPRCPLCDA
ncbi:zinc-alpha-2-glycoprotein [Ctenodactylus gundi]